MSKSKMKWTDGDWRVEDPMGPETLSIVTGGQLTFQWVILASVHSDNDSDLGITRAEQRANANLIAASKDLFVASGPAITALVFAQEGAHRDGDAVALAQYTDAVNALIKAQNKALGREAHMTDITPRRAITGTAP